MKRVMKLAAVVMSMMLAVQAEAQLSGLTNSVVPGASDSDASSAVSQEAIVQSYVANRGMLNPDATSTVVRSVPPAPAGADSKITVSIATKCDAVQRALFTINSFDLAPARPGVRKLILPASVSSQFQYRPTIKLAVGIVS